MSTTNPIVSQSSDLNNPETGIVGITLGEYAVYIEGKFITTLYSPNYTAALREFHQLLDERRLTAGRYICSWCGKDMGPAPTEQDSHGICDECAADVLKEYEAGGDGPAPDPQGGYQVVINGEPCMWFDAPEEASRAYHDYYEPTPVFWTFAGQTVELEAI